MLKPTVFITVVTFSTLAVGAGREMSIAEFSVVHQCASAAKLIGDAAKYTADDSESRDAHFQNMITVIANSETIPTQFRPTARQFATVRHMVELKIDSIATGDPQDYENVLALAAAACAMQEALDKDT